MTGPDTKSRSRPPAMLRSRQAPYRVDDCCGGQESRDDREQDCASDPRQAYEDDADQWADDRAEVVQCSFEAVGAAVGVRWYGVRQERVARRDAKSAGGPRARAKHRDLPGGVSSADEAGEDRCRRVAADCDRSPSLRVICERAAPEPGETGEPIRNAFDGSQCRRGSAESAG